MTRLVFFGVDLAELARWQRVDDGIVIRWAEPSDAAALGAAVCAGVNEDGIAGAPHRTAVAVADGRIVGRNTYWVGTVRAGWFELHLQPTDIVATDGFVQPEFRGRRMLAGIKAFAAAELQRQGYRRMVSWCRVRNSASVRAHAAIGAQPLLRLRRIKLRSYSVVLGRGHLWAGFLARQRFKLKL